MPDMWLQVQQLSKLVTSKTRAVVVNFPHNPTGALASKADWEQDCAALQAIQGLSVFR